MKKALSLLLTIVMLMTITLSVPVVHAEVKDDVAETGDNGRTIYFDANSTGWNNYTIIMVYCYCPATGEVLIDWAAKKKGGMTNEGNGIWSYDFDAKKIEIEDGKEYSLIFNADTGSQTHDLLFDTSCFGDTAICYPDFMVENPADSNKRSVLCRWRNHSHPGPMMCITSLGHIVGEDVPAYTTPYRMFVDFLADNGKCGLQNALNYANGKTAQEVIDESAAALGLQKSDVQSAIAEAAYPDYSRGDSYYDWSNDWSADKSSLPGDSNPDSGGGDDVPHSGSGGDSSGGGYDYSLNPYSTRMDPDTPYGQFCDYLTGIDFANDLRANGNKTEQQIIDAAAATYGLYRDDVELALKECGADAVAWKAASSSRPAGKSGLTYVEGGYYLIGTVNGVDYGINNVDKNALMEYKDNSGYYIISRYAHYASDSVEVARYDGNKKFTVVSKEALLIPQYSAYLFFFRPQSDGYNFGFNYDNEYNIGYSSASSSSSSSSGSEVFVYIKSIEDTLSGPQLTWDKVAGVSKYRVFINQNNSWVKLADVSGTSYTHTAAKSGTVYRYTVRGMDANGKFNTSFVKSGWMHRWIAAPKITSVENASDGALIKWNAVDGNARYRVYVKNGLTWDTLGDTYDTSMLHPAKKVAVNPAVPSRVGTGTKIYFDANTFGWYNYDIIMVYLYCPETGDVLIDWASKKKGGMTDEGNGIWSYDFAAKGIDIEPDKQYCLIFNADTGVQTNDLLFDTSCFGDTAVCVPGERVENPADSNKWSTKCRWKSGNLGSMKCITSIGNVVGDVIPSYTSGYELFVNFLDNDRRNGLRTALSYSGASVQEIIDRVAGDLGLTKSDVESAIEEAAANGSNWRGSWDAEYSTLSGNSGGINGNADPAEDGYTYRYMVRCVSYDGYREIGPYDADGVTNLFELPKETPTEKPTEPPTQAPTPAPTEPPTEAPTDPPVPEYLRGDYDGDDMITIMDATRAQNIVAEITPRPLDDFLIAIDADGDEMLTIMDATRIQNVLAELMTIEGVRLN